MDDKIRKGIAGALEAVLHEYHGQLPFNIVAFKRKVLQEFRDRMETTDDVIIRRIGGTEVFFRRFHCHVGNEALAKWLDLNGFESAGRDLLTTINIGDPAFAKEHRNGTQWQVGYQWHFRVYSHKDGELVMDEGCDGRGSGFSNRCRIAYVRRIRK